MRSTRDGWSACIVSIRMRTYTSVITRSRARDIIFRGCVRVVGCVFSKMLPAAVNAVQILVALLYFISHTTIGGKTHTLKTIVKPPAPLDFSLA